MSARSTITGFITPELKASIAGHLGTDRYGNDGEVVHSAMRLLEHSEPNLKLSEFWGSIGEAVER